MSGIFQLLGFKPASTVASEAQSDQTGEQQQQQQTQQQQPEVGENDLDIYQNLLQTAAGTKVEAAPEFSLDPAKLNDVASKLNFTQGIPPELMQKAMGGDNEAFLQVLNLSNQNTFKTAINTMGSLSSEHTKQALSHQQQQLNQDFTERLVTSGIDLNAHPVVKQSVIENAKLLAKQFPNAEPSVIRQQALALSLESSKNLMQALGMQVIDPKSPEGSAQLQKQTAGETDWDTVFNAM